MKDIYVYDGTNVLINTPLTEYSFFVNKNTRMLDVKVTFAE